MTLGRRRAATAAAAAVSALALGAWSGLGSPRRAHAEAASSAPALPPAAPTGAASASPASAPPPPAITGSELQAIRLDAKGVKLDGIPDEAVWQQAARVTGLTSFEPVEGLAPAGQLVAHVFYDHEALYIGARITMEPGAMRGRLATREIWDNDDLLEVMIDPFLDRRTGYDFSVNPYGVQLDWTIIDDEFSSAWDGVWDSATARHADGFSVEMKIPFRTLRFSSSKKPQDWGLGFGFFSGSKKQYDKWPAMTADRGSIFAQLGTLRGISVDEPPSNLDVIPTLVAGYGGAADAMGEFQWDDGTVLRGRQPGVIDPGLDVRYGLTSATNLNLTLNPDFSQVEADADQLEYNLRFPVVLTEKRPFFLEGVGMFSTPVSLLYTRSIVDPIAGLKLSGRQGKWSFGLLSAWDQQPLGSQLAEPARASGFEDLEGKDAINTVARVSYDLGGSSRVGGFFADKALRDRDSGDFAGRNDVISADAFLTFAEIYNVTAQASASYVDGAGDAGELAGYAYSLGASRYDRNLGLALTSELYSEGFRAETSPISRVDIIGNYADATYRYATGCASLPFVEPGLAAAVIHEASSVELLDWAVQPSAAFRIGANADAVISYKRGQETYLKKYQGLDTISAEVSAYPSNALSFSADLIAGDELNYDPMDPYLGSTFEATASAALQPTSNAELELSYTKSLLWRPDGTRDANVDLFYAKLSISFTTRLATRLISQVDTFEDTLRNSALVSYLVHPGTEAYAGYQESDVYADGARALDRRFFVKVSYRWQP